MTRRKRPWPATDREAIAYRCGRRMAKDSHDVATMLAHERMMPTDDMTRKEIEVYYDIDINVWFDWWFRGWRDETEDRELRSKARPPAEDDNHVR